MSREFWGYFVIVNNVLQTVGVFATLVLVSLKLWSTLQFRGAAEVYFQKAETHFKNAEALIDITKRYVDIVQREHHETARTGAETQQKVEQFAEEIKKEVRAAVNPSSESLKDRPPEGAK
jgi:biopolymer transport protein ExbB/TolQ